MRLQWAISIFEPVNFYSFIHFQMKNKFTEIYVPTVKLVVEQIFGVIGQKLWIKRNLMV